MKVLIDISAPVSYLKGYVNAMHGILLHVYPGNQFLLLGVKKTPFFNSDLFL